MTAAHPGATPGRPIDPASLVAPWGVPWRDVRWRWCEVHEEHEREDVACPRPEREP